MSEEQKRLTPEGKLLVVPIPAPTLEILSREAQRAQQLEADLTFAVQGLRQAAEEGTKLQERNDKLVAEVAALQANVRRQATLMAEAARRRKRS